MLAHFRKRSVQYIGSGELGLRRLVEATCGVIDEPPRDV